MAPMVEGSVPESEVRLSQSWRSTVSPPSSVGTVPEMRVPANEELPS